ncbi:hypothetical protein H072_101 [Dactylellina haptotyla CBS 200.50]|uniref:Uncharacterized protein n=1 Tax=Dactylellina haptotyla (strain CBS 200.50) TaxID=1284197 RepID=S8AY64_DACHA|nr:hypothetical protein H072_101 [Dactylellina haptotyla CBS 200.50]
MSSDYSDILARGGGKHWGKLTGYDRLGGVNIPPAEPPRGVKIKFITDENAPPVTNVGDMDQQVKRMIELGHLEIKRVEQIMRNSRLTKQGYDQVRKDKARLVKEVAALDELHREWQMYVANVETKSFEENMIKLQEKSDLEPASTGTKLVTLGMQKMMDLEAERETPEYKKFMAEKEIQRAKDEAVRFLIEERLVFLKRDERDQVGNWVCGLPEEFVWQVTCFNTRTLVQEEAAKQKHVSSNPPQETDIEETQDEEIQSLKTQLLQQWKENMRASIELDSLKKSIKSRDEEIQLLKVKNERLQIECETLRKENEIAYEQQRKNEDMEELAQSISKLTIGPEIDIP